MKGVLLVALLAVLASAAAPNVASAEPQPGVHKKGFRLFARALGALVINRVYCGLSSDGQVCVDSTGSSTIGGGFWPKGTADQYVFNSGLQLAGIIGPDGGPWAGDTTGGFFFDPKGTTQHGEEVQPIYNSTSAADTAIWPGAACVPRGDSTADLFNPLLQTDVNGPTKGGVTACRLSASQGDLWFVSWEGNPSQKAGRKHPLGVAVETRGMGWNFPSGNEDILYYIYTFYNISTPNQADYLAQGVRPSLASILAQKGADFQAQNAAAGVNLPPAGYTITNLFAGFGADMDVSNASNNYSSVNLPFALGYVYANDFLPSQGWSFDNSIFGAPFFPGAGFVGVKYLKSPTGPGAIQLFSNTINGAPFAGAVNDPRDVFQLYRYLSGTLSPATGDQPCNTGNPALTHICYVNNTSQTDMRFFQSSTALTLAPGQGGSIVVAYIFAAPVAVGGCHAGSTCDIKPGNALLLTNAATLGVSGANTVDSISGFRGYTDVNADGVVQQDEIKVVPGSLLGKSNVAQAVFDAKFLLPFAPSSPDFFLIPGDNQTTVLWKPSASEASGDPFFAIASAATVGGNPNPLYDPNYRQFDVEGYRVYRGRVDAPNELTLLAQFDYAGTVINDFTGIINPTPDCAPELGLVANCPAAYPVGGNQHDGTTLTAFTSYPLVGDIIQLSVAGASKGRLLLANNTAFITKSDTAVVGGGKLGSCGPKSTCPALDDTGVPFVYVDRAVRNNFRYFYSVTAFDINSIESGPTSLESPRNTKSTTPIAPASNFASSGQVTSSSIVGRGVSIPAGTLPTIDATTGKFSGPFPAATGWSIGLGAFVSQVLAQPGSLSATLDSIQLGDPYNNVPHLYWFTASASGVTVSFSLPILQTQEIGTTTATNQFLAVPIDSGLSGPFGGNNGYKLPGAVSMTLTGTDYTGLFGRGCINGRPGFDVGGGCSYNGSRWFDGPSPTTNETQNDPNGCNTANFSNVPQTCYNNAGALTGVTTISNTQCYQQTGGGNCRPMNGILAGAWRAGDFNVYWGAGGVVDSVIDITHNVTVPGPADGYSTHVSATWGILNPAAATAPSPDASTTLTNLDFACVEPLRSYAAGGFICPTGTPAYVLSNTAVPGPVGFFSGGNYPPGVPIVPAVSNGFGMYILGDMFTFELAGGNVPAAGTVWALRKYVGAITGGHPSAGNTVGVDEGPYAYALPEGVLPFTAIGAQIQANYIVSNVLSNPTATDLKKVHTVPDPYYVTNEFEQSTDNKVIKFVNLPQSAIIRIYSSSGVLVQILEHNSTLNGGDQSWNVRNRNNQVVASGVYFYAIEANGASGGSARRVGRMTIVNFAQ
jgi:hypothetical protein